MKTRKFKKCLPVFRAAFSYILIFAFWSSVLFRILLANSSQDGAQYTAAESFEPSAQDEMIGPEGTSITTYTNSGFEKENTGTGTSLTGESWNRIY